MESFKIPNRVIENRKSKNRQSIHLEQIEQMRNIDPTMTNI